MSAAPPTPWQPWKSRGEFNDVDAQAAYLHGYDQQYQQLSGGPFEGCFRSFHLGDDLGIHFEMANRALAQSASTPPGRFAVCLMAAASPPCTLNATMFTEDHVALCPENRVLEGKTAAGVNLCCMDIATELLVDEEGCRGLAQVLAHPERVRRVRELVASGMSTFSALDAPVDYPAAVKGFKSSLGDLLWQSTVPATDRDTVGRGHRASARTTLVFGRARDYIHDGIADGISIVALCKAIGVSRRSLESVFRSVIGMGPGNYVRIVQLNLVRRDLMSGSGGDASIGVISARRGVWHWSRFSNQYRLLFGELPSQTRLRQLAPR